MKAVQYHDYGDADVLGVDAVDRPTIESDEILVDMQAASVNPVDVMIRSGEYGDIPLPTIPGGDGAGVVATVGEDIDAFEDGDRVFVSGMDRAKGGTFAEYASVPAHKLAHLPEEIPFEAGAAIANVGATAWTALNECADIDSTDTVLIHGGAGGVGHAAVQIAASTDADVIATAGSKEACDRVQELGASRAFEYHSASLAEDILSVTDGDGVDIILDHRLEEYLGVDFNVAAPGGQIISLMGHLPETNGVPFYTKELTIRGLRMDNHPNRTSVLSQIARLMERDELTAVVAETYDFDEVAQAHRDLLAGGYVGKLVVTP